MALSALNGPLHGLVWNSHIASPAVALVWELSFRDHHLLCCLVVGIVSRQSHRSGRPRKAKRRAHSGLSPGAFKQKDARRHGWHRSCWEEAVDLVTESRSVMALESRCRVVHGFGVHSAHCEYQGSPEGPYDLPSLGHRPLLIYIFRRKGLRGRGCVRSEQVACTSKQSCALCMMVIYDNAYSKGRMNRSRIDSVSIPIEYRIPATRTTARYAELDL